ncbi:hypothetical protein Fcan01_20703 [Folsomia candida]|uniref:Uncharacterized protein n=1 Tax=Folsomia candida TaxID=158441 RepID=A0A226DFC9_FOLCA|nr:hypothetical protein Fcan01_20703 [Folsomia candida]
MPTFTHILCISSLLKFTTPQEVNNAINLYDFIPTDSNFDFQIISDDGLHSAQFHQAPSSPSKYSALKVLQLPQNLDLLKELNLYADKNDLARAIPVSNGRFAPFKVSLVMPTTMSLLNMASWHWEVWLHPPVMTTVYWSKTNWCTRGKKEYSPFGLPIFQRINSVRR